MRRLAKEALRRRLVARTLRDPTAYRFLYARAGAPTIGRDIRRTKRGAASQGCLASMRSTGLLTAARGAQPPVHRFSRRLRAARLTCLLEVVYATGLRVRTARWASAAERSARMLVVRGKGARKRLVPLNEAAKLGMATIACSSRSAQGCEASQAARNGCFHRSARAAT